MEGEGNIHLCQQLEKAKSELQKAENVIVAKNKESNILLDQADYLRNVLNEEREQQKLQEKKITELEDALNNAKKVEYEQGIKLMEMMELLEEERAQTILLSNEKTLIENLQNSQASFEVLITNWEHAYNELLRQKWEAELRAEEQLKATLEHQNRLFNDMYQKMVDQMQMAAEQNESMTSLIMNMEEQIQQLTSRKRGMGNWRNLIRIKKLRRYLKRRQGLQSTSSP